VILWIYILPFVSNKEGIFNIEDIINTIKLYYGKWDKSRTYFKINWLKRALDDLYELDWIKKISSDNYKIIKTLDLSGDVKEIVFNKLAKLIYDKQIKSLKEQGKDKKVQIGLNAFFEKET
jgi:hypothetical protein